LCLGSAWRSAVVEEPLREARVEVAWTTERDLRIDYYWDTRDIARTRAVAKQVVATRSDLIVTVTTPPTQALCDETRDIPIIFLQVFDPVSTGLVASLARPGGNITGFTNFEPSIASKWLQLLKEIAPRVRRVAPGCMR
jgi:putative tryptophan/tyrosine transport system substrate-binding protein